MNEIKILKRINIYLLIALFVYYMLDGWHTQLLLATGIITEMNPVFCFLIDRFGICSVYISKLVIFLCLTIGIYKFHKKVDRNETSN